MYNHWPCLCTISTCFHIWLQQLVLLTQYFQKYLTNSFQTSIYGDQWQILRSINCWWHSSHTATLYLVWCETFLFVWQHAMFIYGVQCLLLFTLNNLHYSSWLDIGDIREVGHITSCTATHVHLHGGHTYRSRVEFCHVHGCYMVWIIV